MGTKATARSIEGTVKVATAALLRIDSNSPPRQRDAVTPSVFVA